MTLVWVIVALLILAGVIAWFVHRSQTQAAAGPKTPGRGAAPGVMPVGVATAQTSNINVYIDGLGAVTPRATVTVHTRVAGQLMRVLFTEGQMVKKDALLAEVDPAPFRATLEQAEGQLQHDQALLANARVDLERYKTLLAEDSIAKQTLDTQFALVKQTEGTVKSDQGTVDSARVNLDYTRITAPVAGRVGLRQVDPGNVVQPSDANGLVVITQLTPIDVVFTVPQDDIPRVVRSVDSNGSLAVDAYDRDQKTKLESGKLLTIDNQIDVTTGTVKLKATFENAHEALFPNQFVNVRMLIDILKGVVVVPVAAVQRGAQGTFAYVVKADQTVTARPVTLGTTEGDRTSVKSGIAAGEVVVTDGADKLREGAKVETVDRAKQPAGVAPPAANGPATKGHGTHKRDAQSPTPAATETKSGG